MLSGTLDILQQKLGVPPSGKWDPITMGALAAFQAGNKGLMPTGHPDVPTLALLGYYDPVEQVPNRWGEYLEGAGKKPGTFARDLASASNQAPQWAWLAVGAVFLGVGFWTWRKSQKKGA